MDNNSFFSTDRLVEFGLGMAMAQQMVNAMNQSMQGMYIPGSIQSMPAPKKLTNIYVELDGRAAGPYDEDQFASLIANGRVNKDTLSWLPGIPAWKPVEKMPELLRVVALAPPSLPNNPKP